jgi:4'-phosphopantetheinyl transferase EntD
MNDAAPMAWGTRLRQLLDRVELVDLHPEVGLAALEAELAPDEQEIAAGMVERRRRTFAGGRVALRRALAALGAPHAFAIASNERGAPRVPGGWAGSIAHKDDVAAAVAARREGREAIGLDVEVVRALSAAVAARVLTEEERAELGGADAASGGMVTLERFSAKEAVYKAIDPFLGRYVGFREVSLVSRGADIFEVCGEAVQGLEVWVAIERRSGPRGQPLVLAVAAARER